MLRPGSSPAKSVRLVLETGSRAGLAAPLKSGFYMIGRHRDCQIRPKSRSVSRRHCVLHRHNDQLLVMDLKSASGTRLNGEKIASREWIPLDHDDTLRCGKILFRVAIEVALANPIKVPASATSSSSGSGSMLAGEAWQEFNVAEFLDEQDEADRQDRYDTIRATQEPSAKNAHDSQVSEELDIFEDQADDDEEDSHPLVEEEEPQDSPAVPIRSKGAVTNRRKRRRKTRSGPGFFARTEQLKMLGAVVLTLVMLAGLAYSGFSFWQGTEIRVIEDLDR